MGKTPYLFRRKNVFYFRLIIPTEHRDLLNFQQITISLRTQNKEEAIPHALKLASHFKLFLHDLKTGKATGLSRSELIASVINVDASPVTPSPAVIREAPSPEPTAKPKSPALSVVVEDFLKRYDPTAKVMLGKLNATLPLFVELIEDKPINEILQADINQFFDNAQRLPVRRDAKQFIGLPIRKIIENNTGQTISEKTFKFTYRACVSVFLNWAAVHYKDQGFPSLSVDGAIYRGDRADGISPKSSTGLFFCSFCDWAVSLSELCRFVVISMIELMLFLMF